MIGLAEFKITVSLSDDYTWSDARIEMMIDYMIANGVDEDTIKALIDAWLMDDDIIVKVEQIA
jgi:hypothetical protein